MSLREMSTKLTLKCLSDCFCFFGVFVCLIFVFVSFICISFIEFVTTTTKKGERSLAKPVIPIRSLVQLVLVHRISIPCRS